MIFVTVGTQLPFDRLISTVDVWAANNNISDVFAQTGPTELRPSYIHSADFVSPSEAREHFMKSDFIISHAGMGSILTSLQYRKPIIIMPRRAVLGEHRNDHQLATAKWLGMKSGIFVAEDEKALLDILHNRNSLISGDPISDFASDSLLTQLKSYIDN